MFLGTWSVALFAITHTAGCRCLYYSFAVLLHPIVAGTQPSVTTVTGALATEVGR